MTSRPALLHRLGLTLAAAFALAACSSEAPAPTAPATPNAPASTATAPATAPTATAPAAPIPARTPGPIVPPSGPAPVAGTDYVEIPGGTPFQPGTGKIEVVEVFGYTCPACASFEPLVASWAATVPADVEFVPVAAPFGGFWLPYAKAYYTAEAMGVAPQSHDAMFKAFHLERSLDHESSDEEIAQFYAQFGVDPKQFASTMSSFAINAKLNRARQFLMRSGVDSTPTMVVNGKYRVLGPRPYEEVLDITDHLIAMERAEASTDAPTAAEAETEAGAGAESAADGASAD